MIVNPIISKGFTPTGTINITNNGVIDVTNYANTDVQVPTTALVWRKYEYDTEGLVVDWTSFYTSGTTDPTTGGTIYSDSSCTTVITTIDTIV